MSVYRCATSFSKKTPGIHHRGIRYRGEIIMSLEILERICHEEFHESEAMVLVDLEERKLPDKMTGLRHR